MVRSKPLPAAGDGPLFFVALVLIPAFSATIAASQADWNHVLWCEAYLVTVFSLAAVQGVAPRAYLRLVEGDLGHPLWVHRGAGLAEVCVVALRLRGATAPAAVLTVGLMGGAAWTWLAHHQRPSRFLPAALVLLATLGAASVPAYAGLAAYASGAASARLILRPQTPGGSAPAPGPRARRDARRRAPPRRRRHARRRERPRARLRRLVEARFSRRQRSQRRAATPSTTRISGAVYARRSTTASKRRCRASTSSARIAANRDRRSAELASGQVVARDGHYPGLAAHPVWDAPPKWLFGLRLQAPQIADEMSEVLFERARLRAEGGAWRDGFLYGGAPGYLFNFELFEVRTAASARRAASFPATTALLDDLEVPDGPRIVGFGRQRPDSALPVHSDKATYVLTAHVPLDLLHEDDAAPAPDAEELAFRRDFKLDLPDDGAGLAFADLDDALAEPVGGLRAVAQWHDATGRPLPPTLVDTSFPHTAYNRRADRRAREGFVGGRLAPGPERGGAAGAGAVPGAEAGVERSVSGARL